MGQDFGPKSAVLDNQKTAALIDDNSRDLQNIRCIRLVSVLKGGVEPPRPFGHTDLNRARLPIPPLELGRLRGDLQHIGRGPVFQVQQR